MIVEPVGTRVRVADPCRDPDDLAVFPSSGRSRRISRDLPRPIHGRLRRRALAARETSIIALAVAPTFECPYSIDAPDRAAAEV